MTKEKSKFAEIYWEESDLENALDVQEFDTSERNIAELYNHINKERLVDVMIEAGWNYIYDVIWTIKDSLVR